MKNIFSIKKIYILITTLIIIIISSYFVLSNKQNEPVIKETSNQLPLTLLDSRFLVLYGKILKVDAKFLNIEIIKDSTLTDYIFNPMDKIVVMLEDSTIIKKYDLTKNTYENIKLSNIKSGDFTNLYINNATSSGYKAIGIKIFDKNIIK